MRIALAFAAVVLTGIALSMLITRPTTTFDLRDVGELVVDCHTVAAVGDSSRTLTGLRSRARSYEIVTGEEALNEFQSRERAELREREKDWAGPYEITDQIEEHCDRRRASRASGSMVLLAPGVFLASTAVALPAIRRASRADRAHKKQH